MPELNLQKELLELTEDLIRIPSAHSRPDAIHDCSAFISRWLTKHHIDHQQHDYNGAPSITVLPQSDRSPILLMAHFDVVEADHETQFTPVEKQGSLYGRGAIDDKYGVALSLILFREHLLQLHKLGFDQSHMPFGLLLTGDEEIGGFNGVGALCKTIDTDFFIAIDGGNPQKVVTKEKGIVQLRLEAEGRASHSARPWLGESAFDILIEDYARLQELFSGHSDDHWHDTLVLTNCHAGSGSTNVLPGQARANIDIRFTNDSDPDALIATIQDRLTSRVIVEAKEPFFDGGRSPYLDLLLQHSDRAVEGVEHGASDARFFSALKVPGVVWGAEGEMSQHTDNEHIVMSSLYKIYDCLDSFLSACRQETRAAG